MQNIYCLLDNTFIGTTLAGVVLGLLSLFFYKKQKNIDSSMDGLKEVRGLTLELEKALGGLRFSIDYLKFFVKKGRVFSSNKGDEYLTNSAEPRVRRLLEVAEKIEGVHIKAELKQDFNETKNACERIYMTYYALCEHLINTDDKISKGSQNDLEVDFNTFYKEISQFISSQTKRKTDWLSKISLFFRI